MSDLLLLIIGSITAVLALVYGLAAILHRCIPFDVSGGNAGDHE